MVDTVIKIEGLTKRFSSAAGPITAIDGLSAAVAAGQVTGLVGPDGAGKTTLIRLIAGLLVSDRGSVRVLGRDSVREAGELRRQVGYMPQSFGLYEELSVEENLNLYADLQNVSGQARRERFAELLRFTGLEPFQDRPAGKLSGGMKQKLGLAATLIRRPRLLLLDEPSVGVDPLSRRELWNMVHSLVKEGMGVLWSTAYLDEAERSDAVLVLDHGRLIYQGAPAEFTAGMEDHSFILSAPDINLRPVQRRALGRAGIVDAVLRGRTLRLVMADAGNKPRVEALIESAEQRQGAEIKSVKPRFEDAYMAALRPDGEGASSHGTDFTREYRSPDAKRTGQDYAPIEVRDLTRRFGDFTAVNRVSFTVSRGEVFGLLGPNGAGKSTIFKMLTGLLPPSEGMAHVAAIDLRRAAAQARGRIGYMAQHFSLYSALSVQQNLRFFSGVYGLKGRRRRERQQAVIAEFGLDAVIDRPSGSLPLGYKQRLSLASAIMHEPEILFLDEPTSGADPLTRRQFWTQINAMAEQGVTILVTTHFMEEAEYCDRLAIIYEGELVALGSPDELKQRHQTPERPNPSIEDAFVDLIETRQRDAGA